MSYLIGIDIGGSKVDILFLNEDLQEIKKIKLFTKNLPNGRLDFLDNILEVVSRDLKNKSVFKMGIAINAAVRNNIILKSSILGKNNFNIEKYIKKRRQFQKTKIIVENDVIAAAKAELKFGWGKKFKNFVVLNIGTGLRLVYCYRNILVSGHNNCAGEISFLNFYNKEFKKTVLLEDILSGKGISNVYFYFTGKKIEAKEIFAKCDFYAKKTLHLFKKNLLFLFQLIAFFYNPEAVVVTGSVFKAKDLFLNIAYKDFIEKTDGLFHFTLVNSKLNNANIMGILSS